MRILVNDIEDGNIRLWLPTGLVFNRFTALFIPAALEPYGIHITHHQAAVFIKALQDSKRRFKNWVLAEVDAADGTKVHIRL